MKKWFIILILIVYQASATVEDVGTGPNSGTSDAGSAWPGSIGPPTMSLPSVSCQGIPGWLEVEVTLTGPALERQRLHHSRKGEGLHGVGEEQRTIRCGCNNQRGP